MVRCVSWVYTLIYYLRIATHMVSGADDHDDLRVISSHVTKWPEGFDMEHDIFVPGKVEEFHRLLTAALRSRGLLQTIHERETTLEEMIDSNPDELPDDIVDAYDAIMVQRAKAFGTVADNMPRCTKMSSLGMHEASELTALAVSGDGLAVYCRVLEMTDIRGGIVQDRLQIKYNETTITAGDSLDRVMQKLELKWWLYKRNLQFCYNPQDVRNDTEGIRLMVRMLMKGPPAVSLPAGLELATITKATHFAGDAFVAAKVAHLKRYGAELGNTVGGLNAHLPTTGGGGSESETVKRLENQLAGAKGTIKHLHSLAGDAEWSMPELNQRTV